jgi:hypothetical protein
MAHRPRGEEVTREEWRSIPGHDGYEASSLGRIRNSTGRVLKPWARLGKYQHVSLGRAHRNKGVHVLVAAAFYGPRPESATLVRHLDGDDKNNLPNNLAYGTKSDNMYDAIRHGTHPTAFITHCVNGHEYTPENTRIELRKGRPARLCKVCWKRNYTIANAKKRAVRT